MKETLVLWLLSMMTSVAPPDRAAQTAIPEARESSAEANQRYREIAESIVEGTLQTKPLFKGEYATSKTMAFVATTFFMESGYRRDVDLGLARTRLARHGTNDFGKSWCMGQIYLGVKTVPDPDHPGQSVDDSWNRTEEGWSGRDLVQDRVKCVVSTINMARKSMRLCSSLAADEQLAAYASGSCLSSKGKKISRTRIALYKSWFQRYQPVPKDSEWMPHLLANDAEIVSRND